MIIVLRPDATEDQVQHLLDVIGENGLSAHVSRGAERVIIGAIGDEAKIEAIPFTAIAGVETAMPVLKPYKLASKAFNPEKTQIKIGDITIGGNEIVVVGG